MEFLGKGEDYEYVCEVKKLSFNRTRRMHWLEYFVVNTFYIITTHQLVQQGWLACQDDNIQSAHSFNSIILFVFNISFNHSLLKRIKSPVRNKLIPFDIAHS